MGWAAAASAGDRLPRNLQGLVMDELTRVALVGTSKASGAVVTQEAIADAGIAELKDVSTEERILLRAGARSLYSQAGFRPIGKVPPLERPRAETQGALSATSEQLLVRAWDVDSCRLIQSLLREVEKRGMILSASLLTR